MSVVQKAPEMALEIESRWDDARAARLSPAELLLYRSNLLGSDKRITNFGGGNTSAKIRERDPLTGTEVDVLWVKGSGGDLGTMKLDGFATLYQDKLQHLKSLYRGEAEEDAMVGYLPHCTFNLNPRAASIDTPLPDQLLRQHPGDALGRLGRPADAARSGGRRDHRFRRRRGAGAFHPRLCRRARRRALGLLPAPPPEAGA